MEVDNTVLGLDAENNDDFDNDEILIFNHKNKDKTENNIDNSAKELTDYFEFVSENVPDLTEDEINKGIEKILERAEQKEAKAEPLRVVKKKKKVSIKGLFIAAVLIVVAVACGVGVVGTSHIIDIENGIATIAKNTLQIVFFDDSDEKYITVDALLTDLESHGYEDVLLPQEFITKSDEYKVSVPEYYEDEIGEQAEFNVICNSSTYRFIIFNRDSSKKDNAYIDINGAESFVVNNVFVYVFNAEEQLSFEYLYDNYHFCVMTDNVAYFDLVKIAKTIE